MLESPDRGFSGHDDRVPFASWPVREVALPDRTYVVRESVGAGRTPAAFIHGLGGTAENWTDLMGLLRDDVDGIAMDLNGFGDSPPPHDGDYTPAGHARGVAALLRERFDGRPVHVFGNSLGGAISVQLAGRYPELVRSLTLVSPALPWRRPKRTNVHLPIIGLPLLGEWSFDRYLGVPADRRAAATINLCFSDPGVVPKWRIDSTIELIQRRDGYPFAREAFLASLRGLLASYLDRGPERPWQLARRVDVPVFLIYGRDDKLVDSAVAFSATRSFREAEVMVLRDCGHVAQMEAPETVAAAWRSWVGRSMSAAS